MMNRIVGLISVALVLSACTQKSAYEAAVEDMDPSTATSPWPAFSVTRSLASATSGGW